MRFAPLAAALALLSGGALFPPTAHSQMLMLPACGTPPATWAVGGFYPPTMNPSGAVCTFASSGSAGADFSANRPAIPNVGAGFAPSGPYANYVLVATAPAATRSGIDVENTSGAQIVIVLDDGTAAPGSAPANASVVALAGGAGVGSQGGSWVSQTEKGRVQVYAPSASAQVMVRSN